ncbi:potassium channel family protein [Thioalkalivibrio sulfidiphilus]|uniref:potassium channel family protein n=1 Tax=Thioalkalivibrio sulfidiphilus TaxID=1033854 RepID=UPI000379E2C4|nr:potassium channel family protein [Thioalkalivibrio sulfidiphilus]
MKHRHRKRLQRFLRDVVIHTPFVWMVLLLVGLWLLFAAGMLLAERAAGGSPIDGYGTALYWGVAAFSTAGIADTPVTGAARFIGALWIVLGSVLFFGTIVATVTAYFMRPLQRPAKQIIDTIEYNLERLDDLSVEELELLKETTDGLIEHMEQIKARQADASRGPKTHKAG